MFARLFAGVALVAAAPLFAACNQGGVGGRASDNAPLATGTNGGTVTDPPDGGPVAPGGDAGAMCAPESCPSPAPAMPNTLCPDGSLAGPVCAEDASGSCQWTIRSCP